MVGTVVTKYLLTMTTPILNETRVIEMHETNERLFLDILFSSSIRMLFHISYISKHRLRAGIVSIVLLRVSLRTNRSN